MIFVFVGHNYFLYFLTTEWIQRTPILYNYTSWVPPGLAKRHYHCCSTSLHLWRSNPDYWKLMHTSHVVLTEVTPSWTVGERKTTVSHWCFYSQLWLLSVLSKLIQNMIVSAALPCCSRPRWQIIRVTAIEGTLHVGTLRDLGSIHSLLSSLPSKQHCKFCVNKLSTRWCSNYWHSPIDMQSTFLTTVCCGELHLWSRLAGRPLAAPP